MHSDCIFKKGQAMCLEKIQRANELMGLNDSSPGEEGGGEGHHPWHIQASLRSDVPASGRLIESSGGYRSLGPSESPLG